MGCTSSKSPPIVESDTNEKIGKTVLENGKSVLTDVENKIDDLKDYIHNAADNLESSLLGSPVESPATERIGDSNEPNADGAEGKENATDNATDDGDGLANDKPATTMPESVKMNAQTIPFDTIAEEKRLVTIPSNEEAATTVEILTIGIAEIPIEDDPSETTDQNKENENNDEKKEEKEK